MMVDLGQLAPHEQLLVRLARRTGVDPAPLEDYRAVLEDPSARARLVRLAKQQKVHGLALSALVGSPLIATLSADVVREIMAGLGHLHRQAALWDMELDRLLSRLHAEGLRPVILKGGALRETVYQRPAQRSMGDLDLLLPPGQLEPAKAVLERLGYRTTATDEAVEAYRMHHFHLVLAHPKGFVVEIHWALSRAGGGFHLDERAFLGRTLERPRAGGGTLRVPSAEDMILHMASQNHEDAFGRLQRLVDLDRIVASAPDLDWAYLCEASKKGDLQALVALSLRLCQLLLGTRLPSGFVEDLTLSRLCRLNLMWLRPVEWVTSEPAQRRAVAADALLLWTTVGWRGRLHYCLVKAWPQVDPLSWMWRGEGKDQLKPGWIWPLVKLAVYQIWICARGLLGILTPSGRRHSQFWTDAPSRPVRWTDPEKELPPA
jgi:Uncharacterised nucleotidyltransferase